jgi:hypothetical protein
MKLTDKALLDYWKKFRSECDILIERDINGAIAEQIIMTDATIEMIGTIEAQQQEIEQLKTAINAQGKEIIKRGVGNVKLQQENERLKVKYDKLNDFEQTQCVKLLAHNGAMREALQNAIWDIRSGYLASIGSLHNTYTPQISVKRVDDWEKALSTTPADYHNPADVKALAKAREALENIAEYWNGDNNAIAMMDACTNNRETAIYALAKIAEVGEK